MFRILDSKSNHQLVHFKSQGCPGYSHGEPVVAIGSKVSRKTVNSAYQDSSKVSYR